MHTMMSELEKSSYTSIVGKKNSPLGCGWNTFVKITCGPNTTNIQNVERTPPETDSLITFMEKFLEKVARCAEMTVNTFAMALAGAGCHRHQSLASPILD